MRIVDLRVSLSANNPSGRANIYGGNITIKILDMPFGDLTGLVEMVNFTAGPYGLKRESTHSLRQWVAIRDQAVLSYIAARHKDVTSFKAALQVSTAISSAMIVGRRTRSRVVTHYCWPVTVSLHAPMPAARAL